MPLVGGDQLREPRGDRAPGLAAAGVDDPARRVTALEPERELAVRLGVEAHPASLQLLDRGRRLAGQHLDRARAAEAAAGGERVVGVALGRVVGGERRGEPALRPEARALGERLARDEHRAGAGLGRLERDVEAGGAAADDHDRRSRWLLRAAPVTGGLPVPAHRWRSTSRIRSSHQHDTGAHPENAAPAGGDRGGARAARAGPGSSGSRRRRRRASSSSGSTTPAHVDAIEAFCARGRRDDRPRHGRLRRLLRGRAARRRRRRRTPRSGCSPATRDAPSAACARPATTPSATGRWASACSTTSPSPPATRSPPAAPSGCWCSTGTSTTATAPRRSSPPRPTCSTRASTSGRSIRAPAPAEYGGDGEGEGYTVNLPVPPGAGREEFLALVEHVVVPIARAFEPGLIAISAGYDAHRDDPLASCAVETDAYGEMTAAMRDVAAELGAPVLVCLEGGYAPAALAASVVATIARARGDAARRRAPASPRGRRASPRPPVASAGTLLARARGPAGP